MSIQSSRVFVIYYIQNKLQAEFIESPRKAAEEEEMEVVEEVEVKQEEEDQDEGEGVQELKQVRDVLYLHLRST